MTWLRTIYNFFYEIFLGCSHGHLTRPFTLQHHSYKVCLDCGKEFPYSLEKMRTVHPWEAAKLPSHVTELTPIATMPSAFADGEDYRRNKAIA